MATEQPKEYLDRKGLKELVGIIKPMLLSTEQSEYLNKTLANPSVELTAKDNPIEYRRSVTGDYGKNTITITTKSNGNKIDPDEGALPKIYKGSSTTEYTPQWEMIKTDTGTYQFLYQHDEAVTFKVEANIKKFKASKSLTINAYSKIKYGSSTNSNILTIEDGVYRIDPNAITLTKYDLTNTSQGKTITIAPPPYSTTYYGYILIPVGIADAHTVNNLGAGGVIVATNLKNNPPAAALPGNATIYFAESSGTSGETPEYVYDYVNNYKIKYRFLRTPELSSDKFSTISITLN